MKVLQLSDKELSRMIAEFLEPKPDEHLCSGRPYNPYAYRNVYECPACLFRGLKQRTFQFFTFTNKDCWQPRDMVNDPEMTVLLLEKLLPLGIGPRLSITAHGRPCCGISGFENGWSCPADTLGRAIAESFALANGITPSSSPSSTSADSSAFV